ncbi:TrkH family potassium uptake protein [Marininema halotolerans]|uniref:Trk system potassium uptake protein TrkH n=1 Tax=Marininema halotolerans TaxID=1155944 RepID=A0A1I6NR36_9BACL|nr:TrkH family potassium uptake protein [Marininema halotolerans]SFS30408.1 trk system potassium uptake protein TrkH [Marininema halotolerans]
MAKRIIHSLSPLKILVLGFAVVILAGAVLLSLPIATESGESISFLDALFTATSAVCVTGLVVVDTATTFSTFGEGVILLLIQLGGLGFMTFGVLFAIFLGKRIGVKSRRVLQESFQQRHLQGIVRLTQLVLTITLVVEAVGVFLLSIRWVPEWGWSKGLYYALFHSVSAFNNAGFDLFGDEKPFSSLSKYVGDPLITLTIAGLFIIGGLGFVVMTDLIQCYKTRNRRLSLHTKLVLTGTGILIMMGTLSILLVEWANPRTLAHLSWSDKLLASFFQGVTPRTAGFNTLDIAHMYPASQFIIMMLMFVGAAPSSTGGGIKVTTFVIVLLAAWSMIRGQSDVVTYRRRIPYQLVYRALTVFVVSLTLIVTVTILLTITEHTGLTRALFEVVSASGTVGMSLNLTPELTPLGKVLITFTMFAGRLGPLTLAYALAKRDKQVLIRYPEESPLTG